MAIAPRSRTAAANRRGILTVLASLCLLLILGLLAFTIDLGYIVKTESELQNAADAAAMSAARALPDRQAAIAAAIAWAGKHKAAGQNITLVDSQDVEIGLWDQTLATFTPLPPHSSLTPNAVRITCRRDAARGNPLRLSIASIIGTDEVNLMTTAVAHKKTGSCGGIMALDSLELYDRHLGQATYTDSFESDLGDYLSQTPGNDGSVCCNGQLILHGNSYVNGDAKWWQEAPSPNGNSSQVFGEFTSFDDPIEFPAIVPGNASTANNNSDIPLSDHGVQPLQGDSFSLNGPGDSVTLPPGKYYFNTMTVGGGSTVYTSGPTYIYVLGMIDLRHGGIVNSTRRPIDLQIYPMGSAAYCYLPFGGELHATIYSTQAHIHLYDSVAPISLQFFGAMVGKKIKVCDAALHVDRSVVFGSMLSGGDQIWKSGVTIVQ
jgi:Flp pilus assembly protein TadG